MRRQSIFFLTMMRMITVCDAYFEKKLYSKRDGDEMAVPLAA